MTVPKRLSATARKKWVEIFTDFSPRNPMDIDLAAQYCEQAVLYDIAYAESIKADLSKSVGRNGALQPPPEIAIMNKAQKTMLAIYRQLQPCMKKADKDNGLL